MKKISNFIVTALLLFLLFGCFSNTKTIDNNSINTLQKIIDSKEIHVGYFIFEPTVMKDAQTDTLNGIFVDMIREIARSINPETKIIFHPTKLSTFHTELNSRQFDICIGATFATPKRAAVVAFSHPLFYCGYTGVTKKGNANKYKSWSSIDQPNVKLAVLQGSAISDLVRSDFKNKQNVVSFPGSDLTIPLAAVGSNQADVGLMNQITVFTFLREHPELEEVMGNEPLATTCFSWAVRHNDVIWLNYINTCIDYMQDTGEMLKYERKYKVPLMHRKVEFNSLNN